MDTINTPTYRKKLQRLSSQLPSESRKKWKDVTTALRQRDVEAATDAKHAVSITSEYSRGTSKQRTLWNQSLYRDIVLVKRSL